MRWSILGSATPSLESYCNARSKKFHLLSLPHRIDSAPCPESRSWTCEEERRRERNARSSPGSLEGALRENAGTEGTGPSLFEPPGFSTFALCRACGFVYSCPNCSVSLTYHLPDKTFRCHYCDYMLSGRIPLPGVRLARIVPLRAGHPAPGGGDQKEASPRSRWAAWTATRPRRKASHQKILGQVRRGEINLLIGTQMITKGHDLPRVTLVGVLAADLSLNVPDFRAGERTFQLLTQVAGRAGRGDIPGQGHHPDL